MVFRTPSGRKVFEKVKAARKVAELKEKTSFKSPANWQNTASRCSE